MRLVWRATPLARAVEALGLGVAAGGATARPAHAWRDALDVVNVVTRGHLLSADLGP